MISLGNYYESRLVARSEALLSYSTFMRSYISDSIFFHVRIMKNASNRVTSYIGDSKFLRVQLYDMRLRVS